MKKMITMLGLVMAMSSSLFAQTMNVDGVTTEVQTKNIKGRTFVKLREVSELLDCETTYNSEQKTATVVKPNEIEPKTIELIYAIGSLDFEYSYSKMVSWTRSLRGGYTMDTKPQIIDDSIYLPLRYVAEPLGYNISMNENKEIILEKRA